MYRGNRWRSRRRGRTYGIDVKFYIRFLLRLLAKNVGGYWVWGMDTVKVPRNAVRPNYSSRFLRIARRLRFHKAVHLSNNHNQRRIQAHQSQTALQYVLLASAGNMCTHQLRSAIPFSIYNMISVLLLIVLKIVVIVVLIVAGKQMILLF